jgi:hypothetical protein
MRPDVAAETYLIPRIKAARAKANTPKVHIVAHSMGGLVARSYIQSEAYQGDVDRFAMVEHPTRGPRLAYLLARGAIHGERMRIKGGDLYTHVAEDLYSKMGERSLESLYQIPVDCQTSSPPLWCSFIHDLPEHVAWNEYRKEIRRFFAKSVPSMKALMPYSRRDFLEEGGVLRGVGCYQNEFLDNLNDPVGHHLDRIGGVVKTKIFAGILEDTVDTFAVGPSDCSADRLSPDGEFRSFSNTTDGDGTVRFGSAWARSEFVVPTRSEKGPHAELLTVHKAAIAGFLFDTPASSTSSEEAEGAYTGIEVVPSASPSAPNVELRVAGRARPYLTNSADQGCGLKPGTSEPDQTSELRFHHGATDGIAAEPHGYPEWEYTLTLTSGVGGRLCLVRDAGRRPH